MALPPQQDTEQKPRRSCDEQTPSGILPYLVFDVRLYLLRVYVPNVFRGIVQPTGRLSGVSGRWVVLILIGLLLNCACSGMQFELPLVDFDPKLEVSLSAVKLSLFI